MPLAAMGQRTTVTATVRDTFGNLYANCRGDVVWTNQSTTSVLPNVSGSVFQTDVPISGCGSDGTFSIKLWPNSAIQPQPSQWKFIISDRASVASFSCLITISGASQDVSAQLQACAAPLSGTISGGPVGGTLLPAINGTYDLGSTNFLWNNVFANNLLIKRLGSSGCFMIDSANSGQWTGTTVDAWITAAITALPTNGGCIDIRGLGATAQTWAAPVTLGSLTKGVTLYVDRMTKFTMTSTGGGCQLTILGGSAILGSGENETLGGQNGGFVLSNSANVSNILCLSNQGSGAGFAIENITINTNTTATVTDAVVNLTNPLQIGTIRALAIGAYSNTTLFKITQTVSGSVGPINIYNAEFDCNGTTGCHPIVVQGVTSGGSMGGINFYGGTFVHPGPGGIAIMDCEGVNPTNNAGSINMYGPYFESQQAADIGVLVNNCHGVHVHAPFFSARTPGADCLKITTSGEGVDMEDADNFNGWTNNVNNVITGKTWASANGNRFTYHYQNPSKTNTFVWESGGGNNVVIDQNGLSGVIAPTTMSIGPPASGDYFLKLFSNFNGIYGASLETIFALYNNSSGTQAGQAIIFKGDGDTSRAAIQAKTGSTASDTGTLGFISGGQGNSNDLNADQLWITASNLSTTVPLVPRTPGSNTITLGTVTAPFNSVFIGGAANTTSQLLSAATGNRTATLPDTSGTLTMTIGTGNVTTPGTAIGAGTTQTQTTSISNVTTGMSCIANLPNALPATWQTGIQFRCDVTSAGTVTVSESNPTAASITPAAQQVNVRVIQ